MSGLAKNGKLAMSSAVTSCASSMAEPELTAWAEQRTVESGSDTALVRLGAIAFWTIVACLLLARVFLVDAAKLRPEASSAATALSAFHLTSTR